MDNFTFKNPARKSLKDYKKINKIKLFEETKKNKFYLNFLENFPDAKLLDIRVEEEKNE